MIYNDGNVFTLFDFDDSMESNVVLPLTKEIQKQRQLKNGRIDLYINSFGGYAHLVGQLTSLVEIAKRNGVMVRTIVPDVAYSAGSMLAITGTPGERYIERTAKHLIHYGTDGSFETTPEQVVRNTARKMQGFKDTLEHYKRYTDIPWSELDRLMNDDAAYITAAKCIKWGLADKYVDKFDIGEVELS